MRFYLGTHMVNWLERVSVPLFVSRNTLKKRKSLPRARGPWALDSGGFTEVTKHGRWRVMAREYCDFVRRCRDEMGNLSWAAPQDWMCEPVALYRAGEREVLPHILKSVQSWFDLKEIAPDLPIAPVLQGGTYESFMRSLEEFDRRGANLAREPIVGLGSVCKQQSQAGVIEAIYRLVSEHGLRLHAFGFKTLGLNRAGGMLASSDSLAWSTGARYAYNKMTDEQKEQLRRLHGHPGSCVNCLIYALEWRRSLLSDECLAEETEGWRRPTEKEQIFRGLMGQFRRAEKSGERASMAAAEREAARRVPAWSARSVLPGRLSGVAVYVRDPERERRKLAGEYRALSRELGAEVLKEEGSVPGGQLSRQAWKREALERGEYLVEQWRRGMPTGWSGQLEMAARDRAADKLPF